MRKIQIGLIFEILKSGRVLHFKCLRDSSGLKRTVWPKDCISEICTLTPVLQKRNFLNKKQKTKYILEIVPKAVYLMSFFYFPGINLITLPKTIRFLQIKICLYLFVLGPNNQFQTILPQKTYKAISPQPRHQVSLTRLHFNQNEKVGVVN